MRLSELVPYLSLEGPAGDLQGEVTAITHDSRTCREGALFVAIPGLRVDGHDFIPEAVRRGARHIVHERNVPLPQGVTGIRVADARLALGRLARAFYGDPSREICLIGVVGTNGKTTVTYLLESILRAGGQAPAVIGTVNYRFRGETRPAPNTTPESSDLQRIFREMKNQGATHVVMEVSSHAVDLHRVDDCAFDAGIFTNLSQDHLDYHKTMENYFLAKKRFFSDVIPSGGKRSRIIVNADDPWGRRLLRELPADIATFGFDRQASVSAGQPSFTAQGIQTRILARGVEFDISSPLIGRHNLSNILAAVAVSLLLDIPVSAIRQGIAQLACVPGRLERVGKPGGTLVFVDYAHTDDALRQVLTSLAPLRRDRIITVFGCGGDRDRGKRPLMGKTATTLSDVTILTSDNPRSEDPLAILGEIEKGIESGLPRWRPEERPPSRGEKGYLVIPDRREAIRTAIAAAGDADIVLIAGKGHESHQLIGTERIPFDDRQVASQILEEIHGGHGA